MFRSVKNWLTLLIAIVVAFAMLVAWVYVVPPLRGRLVGQKLAEARGNAQLITNTLLPWLGTDPETGQPAIKDSGALITALNSISSRFAGRALVFTRNQVLMAASSGQTSPDVADYPMLEQAIRGRQIVQGTTANGRLAAAAVPLYPEGSGAVIAAVLVIATQFTKAVAPLRDLGRQAALMDKGIEAAERGDLAAGSQAVLVTFQKILDPTSVVRESEYARSAAGQSLVARARGAVERLAKGGAGVPVSELRKFARLAHEMMEGTATAGLKATTERIDKTADRYNIPRELVLEEVNLGSQPVVPVAGVKIKSITPIP